jgi:hypothetical protein
LLLVGRSGIFLLLLSETVVMAEKLLLEVLGEVTANGSI